MICNPQLLSEDGESQTESLPSRVKSVRKQIERLRGSSRAPLSKERGVLGQGQGRAVGGKRGDRQIKGRAEPGRVKGVVAHDVGI